MSKIKPELVRQLFVILVIVLLAYLITKELIPYLSGILGAITLHVILSGWMKKLTEKGWNASLAAALLMFLSLIVIIVPVSLTVLMLTNKVEKAVTNSEQVVDAIKDHITSWELSLGYDLSSSIDVPSITDFISTKLQSLAGGTVNAVIALGIMYFILYYTLTSRNKFMDVIQQYIPLQGENIALIGKESSAMVRSNAIGIPLVALAQGIVALIGFLIFGVPDPMFWFVITVIGSMIPFIGTFLSIIPVTILMFANGEENWQAIGILLYGVIIVGSTDNLIRLYVLERLANVHPLVTLIGVIVGVPLFGFIGLIFGPLLVSLFMLIIKIYKEEYGKKVVKKEESGKIEEDIVL